MMWHGTSKEGVEVLEIKCLLCQKEIDGEDRQWDREERRWLD